MRKIMKKYIVNSYRNINQYKSDNKYNKEIKGIKKN